MPKKGYKYPENRKKFYNFGNKSFSGRHHSIEAKRRIGLSKSGKNNPCWLGGLSYKDYSFKWTPSFRAAIRKRDNYICYMCKRKYLKSDKREYPVHHIDYDKKNCDINNLITLCIPCHMKTNFNREYWKEYFKNRIIY